MVFRLPKDLQLEVLDHVPEKSDLKVLCRTCSAFRDLAVPRLYQHANFYIRDPYQLMPLMRERKGAGPNFRHTRSINMYDTGGPYEAECNLPVPHYFRTWNRQIAANPSPPTTISALFLICVEANLDSLRFPARRPEILEKLLETLPEGLQSLQHLHLSIDAAHIEDADYVPGVDSFLKLPLKTLDLHIHDPDDSRRDSVLRHVFSPQTQRVQRLYFGFRWIVSSAAYFTSPQFQPVDMSHFDHLQELSLRSVNLTKAATPESALRFASKLRSLTLVRCFADQKFLELIGSDCTMIGSALRHLAIHFQSGHELHGPIDNCLQQLYDACEHLESLHLQSNHDKQTFPCTVSNLKRIGHGLRSLSFGISDTESTSNDGTVVAGILPPASFLEVCTRCPNLEQLGYNIEEAVINDDPRLWSDLNEHRFPELDSLRLLTKLRMVHFRQASWRDNELYNPALHQPGERAYYLQKFANHLFTVAERTDCLPDLQYVVWGQELRQEDIEWPELDTNIQQHCFSRGYMSDRRKGGKQNIVVGVPISREELRGEKDADILNWDLRGQVEVRLPGRFYND